MALTANQIKKVYSEDDKSPNPIRKIVKVLSSPRSFFDAVENEKGMKGAFIYFVIITAIYSALKCGTVLYSGGFYYYGIVSVPITWILYIIGSFIVFGIFHLFVRIFGGKQSYYNTYKAFAYGLTPSILLGWIPEIFPPAPDLSSATLPLAISVALGLWSLYLVLRGLASLQKISMVKALVAIVLGAVILLVLLAIVFSGVFFLRLDSAMPGSPYYNNSPNSAIEQMDQELQTMQNLTLPNEEQDTILDVAAYPSNKLIVMNIINNGKIIDKSAITFAVDGKPVSCIWESDTTFQEALMINCYIFQTECKYDDTTQIAVIIPNNITYVPCKWRFAPAILAKKSLIVSVDSTSPDFLDVIIKNNESSEFRTSEISVYVDGQLVSCTWKGSNDLTVLPPEETRICEFSIIGHQCTTSTVIGVIAAYYSNNFVGSAYCQS